MIGFGTLLLSPPRRLTICLTITACETLVSSVPLQNPGRAVRSEAERLAQSFPDGWAQYYPHGSFLGLAGSISRPLGK